MKITKSELKQMIAEDLQLMIENGELDEGFLSRAAARAAGGIKGMKGKGKAALQRGRGKLARAAAKGTEFVAGPGAGDVARQAAGEWERKAGETDVATKKGVRAEKAHAVLSGHTGKLFKIAKEIEKDAKALGIYDMEGLGNAINYVDEAIEGFQEVLKYFSKLKKLEEESTNG
jgi:hypothetical protein